ncbi:sigma-54-dependent transcriptional regulator [methanotrophic endosymbiont of Bathymodiolus puteoserpentis (Logatchev)]|jgi:two-component system response regulator FlrC|uniref:sigma-54-dependent transcriptional regulator n=1 Tax=methanotrophic endosymbiont of Bathymodiolus puteoserpentis (Logatchev) TaxID=343235 RepID=UPI0013C7B475|nr:sigma-54 dependent transcriptional regulator [methanotrophic endosymbiont of Bathymodiolus puteoserpentis (Logatchev)]SHE21929.1 Flagellar regulatory protein FleQ [methanotrophic endosymbiont of Bathymodiolus puteoserpentis (Logatchev)]
MKQYDVLVVEDDASLCEALCDTLEIEGYRVVSARNGTEALLKLSKGDFKLVVSDVQMPVMDGLQLLNNIQNQYASTPVLLMTAYGSVPKAVAAIQAGASDYLVKPFDASALVEKVAQLVVQNPSAANDHIVADGAMQRLYQLADKVAKTEVTILIQGASGVGKEVLAQFVHQNSGHREGPFVAINCAAIPENMLESMLFGYEKGAFTGAVQALPGKFELAQGGTLLLDEISEMDLALQAKLLRVIQEKEVERLGSQKKIKLNVRILATTNRKLKQYVEEGMFREDLYYRLSVFPLIIPDLADRVDDILPLANDLMQRHLSTGKKMPVFSPQAIQKMQAYHWPGNVRELENIVQRALIMQTGDMINEGDLIFEEAMQVKLESVVPERVEEHVNEVKQVDLPDVAEMNLGTGLRSAEDKIILSTLQSLQGSRKLTAEKLGVSPRTLRYKIARMKDDGIVIPC